MLLDIFQYSFMVRGLEAGVAVAVIAPLIGIFLVLRRHSLIVDTLSHVSLAGIAIGFLLGINPVITAIGTTILASFGIEKFRASKRVYGESALALFLSGSLALAIILLSLAHGFNANLFNYLFGSIVTVTIMDVYIIIGLSLMVIITVILFYKELIYICFDEDSARVSGIPVKMVNAVLVLLAAITISLSIPILGVLLISALVVIPVICALQLKKSFIVTIACSEVISLFSVIFGIFISFYLNIPSGGAIVLVMLVVFFGILIFKKYKDAAGIFFRKWIAMHLGR